MNTPDNKPDGTTYELRTLADVFSLPSIDHVRRCLPEVCDVILNTRAAAEALVASMAEVMPDAPAVKPHEAVEFPEVLHWCDDGKGSAELNFVCDGQTVLTISNKPEPAE